MSNITKENADIINSIKKAETLAIESIEHAIKQELFSIENKALNNEHLEKLINVYINETLNDYDNTSNIYKAANEQFLFLKQEYKNELTEDDRFEFIELNLLGSVNQESETTEEYEFQLAAIQQLTDIDTVVFETKLLELKIKRLRELLQKETKTDAKKSKQKENKILSLKTLFKKEEDYNTIIYLLEDKKFISKIELDIYDWHGDTTQTNLKSLKLLGSLAYSLKHRNYYRSNLNKKDIAEAFRNTFPNTLLSNIYYGRIETELSKATSYTKESEYIQTFHFIK